MVGNSLALLHDPEDLHTRRWVNTPVEFPVGACLLLLFKEQVQDYGLRILPVIESNRGNVLTQDFLPINQKLKNPKTTMTMSQKRIIIVTSKIQIKIRGTTDKNNNLRQGKEKAGGQ